MLKETEIKRYADEKMTEEGSDTITLTGSTKVVINKGGFTISDGKGQNEQYTFQTDDKEDKGDRRDDWHRAIARNVEVVSHGGWLKFQHFIEWTGTHEGAFMYHLFRLVRSSNVVTHRCTKI